MVGNPRGTSQPRYYIKVEYRTIGHHPILGLKTVSDLGALGARADLRSIVLWDSEAEKSLFPAEDDHAVFLQI
jgi:hypothetical protein